MENETFPDSREDMANLKDTALDAAKDLRDTASTHLAKAKQNVAELKTTAIDAAQDMKSTAAGHAEKVKGQLRDLASHAKSEGAEQFQQVRGQFKDVADSVHAYIASRPMASVGIALAVGFLFGVSRRRR